MRKLLLIGLVLGNVVGAALLCGELLEKGHADTGLQVSDLTYGSIDTNGDGVYDWTDDWMVERFVEYSDDPQPAEHFRKALAAAVVNKDGGVNLSPYLSTVTAETVEAERAKEGK